MWVRSQNKCELVDCKYFKISDTSIYGFVENTIVKLGEYSTPEKALKVLDILETFIRGDFVTLLDAKYIQRLRDSFMWGMNDARNFIREMQKQVFQIPQSDEV